MNSLVNYWSAEVPTLTVLVVIQVKQEVEEVICIKEEPEDEQEVMATLLLDCQGQPGQLPESQVRLEECQSTCSCRSVETCVAGRFQNDSMLLSHSLRLQLQSGQDIQQTREIPPQASAQLDPMPVSAQHLERSLVVGSSIGLKIQSKLKVKYL